MLNKYYSATSDRNTFAKHVAAPYIRKSFQVKDLKNIYKLTLSVVGIYELFINGKKITKGFMVPYRTNPNHIVYYDTYELNEFLIQGENVIGLMLGNGFSNSVFPGWDFDKLSWAHAPKISLEVLENDSVIFDISSFKCHPSEVVFDDFHSGEHIDANKMISGWNIANFNDNSWGNMIPVDSPKGELLSHPNFYPTIYETVKPIKVIKGKGCYLYDFGSSFTGKYELKIKGEKNKLVKLFISDAINEDKTIFLDEIVGIGDLPLEYRHFDWFILSGEIDHFENRFSYKSGRFLALFDISDEEASSVELVVHKVSSIPKQVSNFSCDNQVINDLQKIIVNSDITNFFYFPTDCPHREKNGWTGDAALSAEQMLINFNCVDQFKEWLKSIIKAQNEEGTIPGIVPTDTWGFAWGNGPGWDTVLFELPYRTYVYSGDKEILEMVREPIIKYLSYLKTKEDDRGLFNFGLGDWLPVNSHTPKEIIDSILCKHVCDLGAKIFNNLGDKDNEKKALEYSNQIKSLFNKWYPVNYDNRYYSQAWGAMAIYYEMYDGEEKENALKALLYTIECENEYMDFGANANRVFWRVLAEHGYTDLAIKMMTQDGNFSFKTWLDHKATTLFEAFVAFKGTLECLPLDLPNSTTSLNHHFWGDISAFYYRHLAGLQINNPNELTFAPTFTKYINKVDANINEIKVHIEKVNEEYQINLFVPRTYKSILKTPDGFACSINHLNTGLNTFTMRKK